MGDVSGKKAGMRGEDTGEGEGIVVEEGCLSSQ